MSVAMRAGTTSEPGCSTRPASGALMDISMSVAESMMPSSRASTSTPDSTWIELRDETALLTIPRHSTSACLVVTSFIGAPRSDSGRRQMSLITIKYFSIEI